MEALPSKIFNRELAQISIRELFEKDEEGNYVNLDTTSDRDTCQMLYRIPGHQRYNKWSNDAKETIIDSIFKNYIIGALSVSRHSDGGMSWYLDIEDGQSRLTVIQEFLEDKFKYRGGYFSERTQHEQNRFLDYVFATDTTTPARNRPTAERNAVTTDDHYFENFDRINRGKALEDNDKYWCMKNKPMVAHAIKLIEQCKDDYLFMKTEKFNTKDTNGKVIRKPLEQIVTMIDALINGIYKKSYSRHYEKICEEFTEIHKRMVGIFMEFYKSIYDKMLIQMPKRDRELFPFNNPGKFLGMIIMHFKDCICNEAEMDAKLEEAKDMWVNILNIDRSSENFMKGAASLWNGFTPADRKNQEQENIRKRLDRVKEFYGDKVGCGGQYHIEYTENEPEA